MNNQEPLTSSDVTIMIGTFFGSMIFFSLCYKSTELYFENYLSNPKNKENKFHESYEKLDNKQRADFVSRVTSQIHAFLSISLAINALFFTCVDPNDSESRGYKNFFNSDYCLYYHSSIWQMITLSFTAGYLLLDIFICKMLIQDNSKLQTQTYIHHVVGISGAIAALIYGAGGALIVANVLLVNEFSTFFLNYRQFIYIMKAQDKPIYTYNAIAFFLSFLLFRIVFNTIVSFWIYRLFFWTIKDKGLFGLPAAQLIIGFYLIFLFIAIYILNLIWFTGLIQMVKRSLKKKNEQTQEIQIKLIDKSERK